MPRLALVIQTDVYSEHPWITVLPVTSDFKDAPLFHIPLEPTSHDGLKKSSEVMVYQTQSQCLGDADRSALRDLPQRLRIVLVGLRQACEITFWRPESRTSMCRRYPDRGVPVKRIGLVG